MCVGVCSGMLVFELWIVCVADIGKSLGRGGKLEMVDLICKVASRDWQKEKEKRQKERKKETGKQACRWFRLRTERRYGLCGNTLH